MMDSIQKISQVQVGQKLTANKMNQLVDAANASFSKFAKGDTVPGASIDDLDNAFYHDWQVNEYQSKLKDGKLDVKSPYVWTGEAEVLAEQYDNVTQIAGDWYAGVKKDSAAEGPTAIFTNNISSLEESYSFQRVFTIYQHPQSDGQNVNPTNSIVYYNIHPSFGGEAKGETQGTFRWSAEYNDRAERYYGTFKYCHFQFGRRTYMPTQSTWTIAIPEDGCTFYLYIPHDTPAAAVVVTQDAGNSLYATSVPLVEVDGEGNVVDDYRGMPVVPVWGTPEG